MEENINPSKFAIVTLLFHFNVILIYQMLFFGAKGYNVILIFQMLFFGAEGDNFHLLSNIFSFYLSDFN